MSTAAPIQPSLFDLVNRLHSDGTIAMSNIAVDAIIPAGSRSQKLPGKVSRYRSVVGLLVAGVDCLFCKYIHMYISSTSLRMPTPQTPFPLLLHNMLSQVEQDGLAHIFSWMPNGKAIKIHDKKAFIETIIPRYFPHQTQFKSYLKQLGLYRFVRIGRKDLTASSMNDDYIGAYHHPDFVQYDLARCLDIKRMKVHSTSSKKKAAQRRSTQQFLPTLIGREGALHPTATELSSYQRYHSQQPQQQQGNKNVIGTRSSCEEQFPQFLGLVGGVNADHGKGPSAGEDGSSFFHPVQKTTTAAIHVAPKAPRRVSERSLYEEIDMTTTRQDHCSGEELLPTPLSPSDVPVLDEAFGRPFFHLFLKEGGDV